MFSRREVPETKLLEFFRETKPVFSLSFVPDNEGLLFSGAEGGLVTAWNLKTHRPEENLAIESGPVQCMGVRFCGEKLLTQDKSGLVTCWKKTGEEWKRVREVMLHYLGFCKLETLDDLISCPDKDSTVRVYDSQLQEIVSLKPDCDKLGAVCCCKLVTLDGDSYAIVGYENSELILWNVKTSDVVSEQTLKYGVPVALDFDEDERMGIVGFTSRRLLIFKIDLIFNISKVSSIKLATEGVNAIRIHKPTGMFAVGCWDSFVKLFSWPEGKHLSSLQFHCKSVEDICFSPKKIDGIHEGYLLAACSTDCKLSVWIVPDQITQLE